MAQRVIISLIDDLDGNSKAEETITFGLDGKTYEIDLNADNARYLREALTPYVKAGRLLNGTSTPTPTRTRRPANTNTNAHAVRAWAADNGLSISPRGRIPTTTQNAYDAYHTANDRGPLDMLLTLQKNTLTPAQPDQNTAPTTPQSPEDAARNHYSPAPIPQGREKNWRTRTATGLDRTDRVEDMTLTERISIISDKIVIMLGQLDGRLPTPGGKVKQLATSAGRLINLEMIQEDPNSAHGYQITPFGRYAYDVRKA